MSAFEGVVFDLDGTVYVDEQPIPGAPDVIRGVRETGAEVLFLTNNATNTPDQYQRRLAAMDVPVEREAILTAGVTTATYVAETHPDATAFVFGEQALHDALETAGVATTSDPAAGDVVVAALDRDLDYDSLTGLLRAFGDDPAYVATNPDRTRPGDDGLVPSTGLVIGAVQGMTGREPDRVAGKPSQVTTDVAMERLGFAPEDCLLVGDRLDTDIEMGVRAGMTTALVLTGVTDRDDVESSDVSPDHVLESIADVPALLE
jgi:HAD superfamily hydrolase (TIGR01457 family)